jgi:hypothetical protein
MFIFDVLSGRVNSPNLLSVLDLITPRYLNRATEFLRINLYRTNYGIHEPMSNAMRQFNEVIGLFDFGMTRNQFSKLPSKKNSLVMGIGVKMHFLWAIFFAQNQKF